MNFDSLVASFSDQPIVESSSIITLAGDARAARVQISRWVASGRLIQLKRGYYLLSKAYRKREPDPHYIANILVSPSYLSLAYALGHYGLIPEAVPAFTSVTLRRPTSISTPVGRFEYRHVTRRLFWGYETRDPLGRAPVQMALPEKALLDFIHLTPGRADERFFESLRLQNLEVIDDDRLRAFAERFGGRKMLLAARAFSRYKIAASESERGTS